MAKMFPPEARSDTPSNAEKKVFDLLKLQLDNDWLVFHSVGLSNHDTKPWAEIDFVAVGPGGVFCLEVKGGRLERVDGRYRYTNRNGSTTVKDQGPFEQVGPAAAKLYKFLREEDPTLRNVPVGYGVMTPDITWRIAGPDIILDVIFDERDLSQPAGRYFERISKYWHDRFTAQGKRVPVLDESLRNRISKLIRGDFDLRPSLKSRVTQAKNELIRLTEEQYHVLDDLEENDRVVIKGGAGSGKTLLAIEEARRRGASEKVLLLCFNRQLGMMMKTAVSDVPNIKAGTLHSFMSETVSRAGLIGKLPPASDTDLYMNFYPSVCLDALLELDELEAFDSIIVDEAQDLLIDSYLEIFNAVLKGGIQKGVWRFFMDANQNVFTGTSPTALAALNAVQPARYSLSVNCRNTGPIAVMTALLSGIKAAHTLRVSGPDVVRTEYSDAKDQRKKISNAVNRLLGQHVSPDEIVILGPRRLENSVLRDPFPSAPFRITDLSSYRSGGRNIRYSTFKAFKGLEADYVLVVDIDDLDLPESLLDIYVGASRACAYLEVFIAELIREQYETRAAEFGRTLSGLYN